ncbi:hypothetical protein ATO7_10923 [Oceanococcus atlanticus]|uniref:Uncharacterized protein n=1 Tax=Oceanococcus atlanticus TaxID=1317117 RepID=A0A1Y1SAY7_9GAMM|nr:hypothetical protein ATO7_10923 [Oceanococcus atlanticus]
MDVAPKLHREVVIRSYIALVNRDRAILSRTTLRQPKQQADVHSITVKGHYGVNDLTIQEIADGSLDGLQLAITSWIRKDTATHEGSAENKIEPLQFISKESMLSQTYRSMEDYWNALVWNDYEFIVQDKTNRKYIFHQTPTPYELSAAFSQVRKQRLEAQFAGFASSPKLRAIFAKDAFLICPKKVGKRKSVVAKAVAAASENLQGLNAIWKGRELFLADEFPDKFLERQQKYGFSVFEALDVFRCLSLLAEQIMESYPDHDAFQNLTKLRQFCPQLKRADMRRAISKATGLSLSKVGKILSFLSFQGRAKEDLWCHPLIELEGQTLALVTAALVTPVMTRVVEHWLVTMDVDLQDKGFTYESTVLAAINEALNKNPLVTDYDRAKQVKVKVGSISEEIDLIARVGNLILIGEIKSIVTTDSPISQYRSFEILEKAAEQISRKEAFAQEHLEEVFQKLGWTFDPEVEYKFAKFVINSSRMFIGSNIQNVPVVDEKIVAQYLGDPMVPYSSYVDGQSREVVHLAWFELYKDAEELEGNVFRYLREPPHMEMQGDLFENKPCFLPPIDASSPKIIYNRLVMKKILPQQRLLRKTSFQIHRVDNAEEKMDEMDVQI